MGQITFKEYRMVDLMILTAMVIVFEMIATYASGKWFWAQAINISITLLMVCITMLRWNWLAAIQAVVGGFVYCIAAGATTEQYIICCVGNLFSLLALIYLKMWGKERVRQSAGALIVFSIVAYLGTAIGRGIISLLFGGNLHTFILYITTDIISLLFAAVVLILIRKSDGLLEDQKAYLFRVEREMRNESGGQEENDISL